MLSNATHGLEKFTFKDVIPYSIGIAVNQMGENEEEKEVMHEIIPKNTRFPVEAPAVRFMTGYDGQTSARVKILQGAHGEKVSDCTLLHELTIENLDASKAAGEETYSVQLSIDEKEVIIVTVTSDQNPSNTKSYPITSKLGSMPD